MWDPRLYLRFADERGRPFHDLVARVGANAPKTVVDLGCGPGNLTETLRNRWPDAVIKGVDSSAEMISEARSRGGDIAYELVDDVREYAPAEDVIVTNATLQWVPGHDDLLRRWVAGDTGPSGLASRKASSSSRPDAAEGRWIAMQVPANFDAPGHVLLRELAAQAGVQSVLRRPVGDAVHYARLLRDAGCEVDAWETNYIHQLRVVGGEPHPVLTWMSGTAMRPVRAALSDPDWAELCAELDRRLWDAYPPHSGIVDFPFLRVFAVAHRAA